MPDENDELNEMLEKYLGPAEAGEKLALEAAANHLSHEFNPPTKYDSGGMWFRNFYIPKSLLRYEPALAGVILPEVALVDLDRRGSQPSSERSS